MPSQEKIFNTRGEADFERPRVGTSEDGEREFLESSRGDQTPKDTMCILYIFMKLIQNVGTMPYI